MGIRSALHSLHPHANSTHDEWQGFLAESPNPGGLKLWLRADQSVTLNGATVSAWGDISGSGFNVTQGTAAQQPTFVAADALFALEPSLSFVAASSQVLANAGFNLAQPDTIYVVGAFFGAAASNEIFDGTTARQVLYVPAGATYNMYSTSPIVGGASNASGHVFCCVFNGASSALYVDNSGVANASGNPGSIALTGLSIGGISGGYFQGHLAEMQAYSGAHSAGQRFEIMASMGARYGIATS